jgi:hypothetical protein
MLILMKVERTFFNVCIYKYLQYRVKIPISNNTKHLADDWVDGR